MASSIFRFTPPIICECDGRIRRFLRYSKSPNKSSLKLRPSSTSSNDQQTESSPSFPSSAPGPYTLQPPLEKIEKRDGKKVAQEEKRRHMEIQKRDPPNFEIGWKRTKSIDTSKPKGWTVADYLQKLEELMGRGQFGSVDLLVKAGEIVVSRVREEAEILDEVDERMITELFRVVKFLEMDLQMIKAAVKDDTKKERIENAMARCRQAVRVALAL